MNETRWSSEWVECDGVDDETGEVYHVEFYRVLAFDPSSRCYGTTEVAKQMVESPHLVMLLPMIIEDTQRSLDYARAAHVGRLGQ